MNFDVFVSPVASRLNFQKIIRLIILRMTAEHLMPWFMLITVILVIIHYIYLVSNYHFYAEVEKCQCPAAPECTVESSTNHLALIFYQKFLTRPFDERKMAVDEENTSFKLRKFNVQFKVTDQQLRKLKEAKTDREIDAVVTSIVEQPGTEQIPTEEENYRLALNFYRKFLTSPFDERQSKIEEENNFFKLRKLNVQFKVTDQQLRKLKEAQTAREIDAVVTIIVEQSETSVYQSMAESLCWNIVAWYGSALQSSIFLYVIVPAVVILSVLSIGRLLGMRLWVLIPFLGILIAYVLTYRDCNNQLELASLTKLMKTYGSNPCGKHHPSKAECMEHLREQFGLKRSFCDPSEVFIEMVAKLHLQYFETFVLKMVSIFKVNTASSGPVETLFIGGSILFLMTVGIMYGLRAVGRFFAGVITITRTREQAAVQGDARQAPAVKQSTNRIEEITEGGSEPNVAAGLVLVYAAETFRRKEDESGDGPAVKDQTTEEGASSDEETSMIQCDVRKDPAENSTGNQSKTSVDQQISAQTNNY